jgi:hypothetical protein
MITGGRGDGNGSAEPKPGIGVELPKERVVKGADSLAVTIVST